MLVVAACKAALLLAMLESSGLAVESSAEVAECLDLELAQLTESEGGLLRRALSKGDAAGSWRRDRGASGSRRVEQALHHGRTDGHRLPNGLLAPCLC